MQTLRNVLTVLAEAGATQEHVAKLTIMLVDGTDVLAGFAASREIWGDHPTAVTVFLLPRPGRPEFLVEIDALAAASVD